MPWWLRKNIDLMDPIYYRQSGTFLDLSHAALSALSLSRVKLTDKDILKLVSFLKEHSEITALSVAGHHIGPSGACYLLATTLTYLNISL